MLSDRVFFQLEVNNNLVSIIVFSLIAFDFCQVSSMNRKKMIFLPFRLIFRKKKFKFFEELLLKVFQNTNSGLKNELVLFLIVLERFEEWPSNKSRKIYLWSILIVVFSLNGQFSEKRTIFSNKLF